MKKHVLFLICLLQFFFISCKKPTAYIIPTDIASIFAEAKANGITAEESDSLSFRMFQVMRQNTEGKKLPDILVKNLANQEVSLSKQINKKTIVLSIDIHCAMGFECAFNEYPNAIRKGKSLFGPTICLVIKTPQDYEAPETFNLALTRLKPLYEKLFIIEEEQARKINLLSGSTRFYVNEEQVINSMFIGNCSADKLVEEMKANAL